MIIEDFLVHYRPKREHMSALGALLVAIRAPGFHAMAAYRLGHWLVERGPILKLLPLPVYIVLSGIVQIMWGTEVANMPSSAIGPDSYALAE